MVNHTRSHRTVNSGGGIARHGGRRAEDERLCNDVIELQVDNAAGKSFISRRGLGKTRHVELRDVCIQWEVGEGKVRVVKVEGKANPANVGTKFLSATEVGAAQH